MLQIWLLNGNFQILDGKIRMCSLTRSATEQVGYNDLDHLVKLVSKRTDCNSEYLGPEKNIILAIPKIWASNQPIQNEPSSHTWSKSLDKFATIGKNALG